MLRRTIMTGAELKEYEVEQYQKAFEIGTDKAWKTYRANVKRTVKKFEKENDVRVNINALMSC